MYLPDFRRQMACKSLLQVLVAMKPEIGQLRTGIHRLEEINGRWILSTVSRLEEKVLHIPRELQDSIAGNMEIL